MGYWVSVYRSISKMNGVRVRRGTRWPVERTYVVHLRTRHKKLVLQTKKVYLRERGEVDTWITKEVIHVWLGPTLGSWRDLRPLDLLSFILEGSPPRVRRPHVSVFSSVVFLPVTFPLSLEIPWQYKMGKKYFTTGSKNTQVWLKRENI